jgi:hypothetical protein
MYFKDFPIAFAERDKKEEIISIVTQIITIKKENYNSDTTSLESEIDRLVYQLYGLTEEEIKIVEGSN